MAKSLEEELLAAGTVVEDAKEPETSKLGAVALGGVQGLTFGFADELEAAARSALSGASYQEEVEQVRQRYKTAQEERPGAYTAAEIGAGIGSMFIPGLGVVSGAKAATAAGKGLRSLIEAKRGAELTAKGARAAEAIGAGVVGGGIGAVGTSEADVFSKQTPEAAAQLAADIGTGAALGGALGGTVSKIAESETVQKAGKAISESKAGQMAKDLRDRILSGGAKNIEEGKLFIGKPEKVEEVEDIFKKGYSGRVRKAEEKLRGLGREKTAEAEKLAQEQKAYAREKNKLSQEISDIQRKESLTQATEEQAVKEQTASMAKEVDDVRKSLQDLGPKIDTAEQTIKTEVEKLSKQLDTDSANAVKKLYDNQLDKINTISEQRDAFVDKTLSNVAADANDAKQLQDAVTDMYSMYKTDYETAIKPVFVKIMRDEPRFMQMMGILDNPENLPQISDAVLTNNFSKADVVKMVENAKKNLYTSDVSTPFGKARRDAYQILNDKMTEISPDYKQFNTQINKLMTTRDVLEKSPLMENRVIAKTGQAGGEYAAPQAFAKTTRPEISGLPSEYVKDLADRGVDVKLLARQEQTLEQQLTKDQLLPLENMKTELTIKNNALQRQISELERQIRLTSGEERIKLKQLLDKKTDDLNLYKNRMTEKLAKSREDLAKKYNVSIETARDVLRQTRQQASQEGMAYKALSEQPLTVEEAGQLGTIAATTGQVPFKAGRFLRPSPMTRIKVYNAISSRFQNPALTAAIAPRIGQSFTRADIMSLADTHGVVPSELEQELLRAGQVVEE